MHRILLVCALLLAACGGDDTASDATSTSAPRPDEEPGGEQPSETSTTNAPSTSEASGPVEVGPLESVVTGLEVPWDIAFAGDDTLLVTERNGRVRVVEDGTVREEPAGTVDVSARGEGGLLGIALHPEFPDDRRAYLYLTTTDGNRVSSFEVTEDLTLGQEQTVLDGIPAAAVHDGGRLAFSPDGMLYVTTGDASDPDAAADVGSLAGKILRVTPDGSVPHDNPFDGSPVWSYGHRNPQGLAWDADGQLFASEHGPTGEFGLCCNDEINRIEPGGFYGWPYLAAGTEGAQGRPPADPIPPIATSGNEATWAPGGMVVLGEGDDRTLLVATLARSELLRFDLGASADGPLEPTTAADGFGRLRVVTQGPDGCLWVATSNRDGRGDPDEGDDRLLRTC